MKDNWRHMISPAKKSWQYFLAIFGLSTLSLPLVYNGPYDEVKSVAIALVWSYSIWITQFIGHTFIIMKLDQMISWMKRPLLRALLGISSMVVYASVAFIFVNLLMYALFYQTFPSGSVFDWIQNSYFAIKISFIVSFIITSIGFFQAWKRSEVEKEKLNTQMMTHKYNALRNQINPHFLFNSLNVLSELVYENQAVAVKFIQQLSDLYRYILSSKNEDLVPLEKELKLVDSYVFLLKTRFADGIDIQVNIPTKEGDYVVPMSLQMLIENAVKHNEVSRKRPLRITLKKLEDRIEIRNNLQPKKLMEESTKSGIDNIKQRYNYLSERDIEIEKSDEYYSVKLPILKVDPS